MASSQSPAAGGLRAHVLRLPAIVVALLLVMGLALAGTPANQTWFVAVNRHGPALTVTASALSVLGLGATAFIAAALLGLRWPRVAAAVLLLVLSGGLLVQAVKFGLAMPRPVAVLGLGGVQVTGMVLTARSMPSGHAAMLGALAALAWLWPPTDRTRRVVIGALLTLLALGGAAARIAVGAHWPSDVLVGLSLGVGVAAAWVGTAAGWRAIGATADALCTRIGTRVMVVMLVATSASLWVAVPEHPAAGGWQALVALAGVAAAVGWWWRQPGALAHWVWARLGRSGRAG